MNYVVCYVHTKSSVNQKTDKMEPSGEKQTIMEGALSSLLDCLVDKDEAVRQSVESSLCKVVEKHPDESISILTEYKTKHPKLSDQATAIILRVIEYLTTSNTAKYKDETLSKIITLTINELTKSNEQSPAIQKPALEILVGVGRNHCEKVMNELINHTKEGHVAHFMIMYCMGTLATANVDGITPFIKTVLGIALPNLGSIKLDHVKQAYAFAIGRFSEALIEKSAAGDVSSESEAEKAQDMCSTEISVAYDVFMNQWMHNREPKVCADILQALSSMYPLLPQEKMHDNAGKLVSTLLSWLRRSIDRNSVTQFLACVLKVNINSSYHSLDTMSDILISSLFDFVCVYPDYEKPQTVKGHYEVLRCYHLLAPIYGSKIMEMLMVQLRSNNERERIKALLVLTHLTNSSSESIENKIPAFIDILKQLILSERSIKMKMTLLKTIVALAQKSFIKDKEFVWFMIRYSCRYNKPNTEHGSLEEYETFAVACQNSIYMLASTVGTMDELLKRELLSYFVLLDYTDVCSNIAKCLSSLFTKNPLIELELESDNEGEGKSKVQIPSPESVFSRCLSLMGNFREIQRISNILTFLKAYTPNVSPNLSELWDHKIPELLLCNGRENLFNDHLMMFITQTIEYLKEDTNFAEKFVNKMADQLIIYPIQKPQCEYVIPSLSCERGMLLKCIGVCLCYVHEVQSVEAKIDLIIGSAKQEKLDKHAPNSDYEHKLIDASKALGYISRTHLPVVLRKLSALVNTSGRKSSAGFFSTLNFIRDTSKESENYKNNLLVFETYGHIIENASPMESLKDVDDTMVNFLLQQLAETKDHTMKKVILKTLLSICNQFARAKDLGYELRLRNEILRQILGISIDSPFDNLPLFPIILKLATTLLKIESEEKIDVNTYLEISCKNFFSCAQNLKTKFDSQEDDELNSFLAQYLNLSLPELNTFVKVIIESNPSPACLDDVISALEYWMRDKNSEVRICTGHVMNSSLEVYIKSMKIGCEAPSKFNQTGQMLGKIVPRCIDSNATVRQTSVDILRKILEISHIYETLTIPDSSSAWLNDLDKVYDKIITDDPKEIYQLAGEIARIIAIRISSFQHLQFCKTTLSCLNDPEQSSAIGASVVLKFFVQQKGSEMFHAVADFIKESLFAIRHCEIARAKSGVLKALVALTKHHPKLVCSEILAQPLPYDENLIEYWQLICCDLELVGTILDNFLAMLSTSCLYEPDEAKDDTQRIATVQPFAIFCALKEIFACREVQTELKYKFPEIFTMMLTTIATYTNLAPPMLSAKAMNSAKATNGSAKSKFGFVPNKDAVKLNPCLIVLEAFRAFLNNLEMEQVVTALAQCPQLANSSDLSNFIEMLTPVAISLSDQFSINSSAMKQIVTSLTKYVSSPYDGQRIAAVGFFSQLVPLKPCGEISSVIMLHLSAALSDPNPIVRGLSIKGLSFVGSLTESDIDEYAELAITSLLKGIDDYNSECLINIPLESMRGLSRTLQTLPIHRVESFHISLSIRIRPFFENSSLEIRESAILLFGDLCESRVANMTSGDVSPTGSLEALKEQLFANLISLMLHLSESDRNIIRASKITLRKVCTLINAPKVNEMAQKHLIDHGQLNYDFFIIDFVKLIGNELKEHVGDLIESCIPFLKSHWTEIRGNAAIIIGILHNFLESASQRDEAVGHKLALLLRDESTIVRLKAATAIGYFFGDI